MKIIINKALHCILGTVRGHSTMAVCSQSKAQKPKRQVECLCIFVVYVTLKISYIIGLDWQWKSEEEISNLRYIDKNGKCSNIVPLSKDTDSCEALVCETAGELHEKQVHNKTAC